MKSPVSCRADPGTRRTETTRSMAANNSAARTGFAR